MILVPVPSRVPPQEELYHLARYPVGAAGLQVSTTVPPGQTDVGEAPALVGAVAKAVIVTVTLAQVVFPALPSNLT